MPTSAHVPELLAPAGNRECARAAVANGADAIYFGLPRFNARMRADNFTTEELPEFMTWLHDRGVRGFVAMNTLIFTSELPAAEAQLRLLDEAGVDAIIVQDPGLARLAKAVAPRLELHASTQMTITSPEGLEFAAKLGLARAVLARELSLRELARFRDQPVPLEVFVHGALCVAYSGQCLTSESLGQRSANRGECAQACRMPYQLIVDGVLRDLGDRRYLLSPQDLAAVEEIPRLIELGVASFKIEGRLKSPEYVAAVTRVYRKAIDAAIAGRAGTVSREDRYDLEMTFSRGLFTGWMHGVDHQQLVGARFGKKRGALVGRVRATGRDWVELDHAGARLKPGDGVVFDTGGDTDDEQGGRVFSITGSRVTFQNGKIDARRLKPGDRVWKTSDPAMERRLRASFSGAVPPRRTQPLHVRVSGSACEPLRVTEGSRTGTAALPWEGVTVESSMPLQPATHRPLTEDVLRSHLGRLGGTRWHLAAIDFAVEGGVMLPLSELNRLRRSLVERLDAAASEAGACEAPRMSLDHLMQPVRARRPPPEPEQELSVLCRSLAQAQLCAAEGVRTIYLDLEDIRGYADAVAWVRAESDAQIYLATPRIQKAGEHGFFKLIERAAPHGVLVRNFGAIDHFSRCGLAMSGDFSLNVANPLTAEWLVQHGLERLTISYDLNAGEVLELLASAPPPWFELTLHQHMPMFHMEHCVFAAFMSNGRSFLDCGRPCDRHDVRLRDRTGVEHPLKADAGCRNTLFNAVPQTGARYYRSLHAAGLRHFRIELLAGPADDIRRTIAAYRSLLSGEIDGDTLWRDLRARSQLGVTHGMLRD